MDHLPCVHKNDIYVNPVVQEPGWQAQPACNLRAGGGVTRSRHCLALGMGALRGIITAGTLGPDAEFKAGCAIVHPRELVGKFFSSQCLCFLLCKQEDSSASLGCWRIKGLNTYKMLRIVPCTQLTPCKCLHWFYYLIILGLCLMKSPFLQSALSHLAAGKRAIRWHDVADDHS